MITFLLESLVEVAVLGLVIGLPLAAAGRIK